MLYILYVLFFLSCILLIGSVLLQPGKTDAGALFTSNVSSTAFAPRGTASVLGKFTIGAAIVFMLSALMISMPALSGNVSVLSATEEAPAEATPTPTPETAPTPVAAATIGPGSEQTITIGDTNAAPANSSAPATGSAVPDQPNPPANK
ncbi:MAG: preprotein translocase subunit SecG [Pyrinomonadaceae bacterium]